MSSWLSTLRGQPTALETLRRALASGRVHHAYLFDGPDGVGKERAAWGLAQALLCERRGPRDADACGLCRPCIRAIPRAGERTALHPDLAVLERGLYDAAAIGRRTPESQDISIDQVRAIVLARAAFPPHEGRAKVFIVRRAEELGVAGANALLKTLEEPGARTYFVLLSSTPEALLPTIRSRTQRLRFGALPDSLVAELLVAAGTDPAQAAAIAPLAGGSVATGLALSDPDASRDREAFVTGALAALRSGDAGNAFDLAEAAKKTGKDTLIAAIAALGAAIAREGTEAADAPGRHADKAAARCALALEAIRQLEANASVQLAVESMFLRMRDA